MKGELTRRRRDTKICWALPQDSIDEWISPTPGATIRQQETTGCFIIIKGIKRVSSIRQIVSCPSTSPLDEEFQLLAEQWRRETGMLSSVSKKVGHPAYQKIIAMGDKALPFILRELRDRPAYWFGALKAITAQSPARPDEKLDLQKLREAWLRWGQERGYLE